MPSRSRWLPYALVAPLLLWVVGTIGVSVGYLVYLSVTSTGILGTSANFVGVTNFVKQLGSTKFWSSAGTTALWVVGNGAAQVTLAFTFARLLARRSHLTDALQTWVVLPWIVPGVAAVIIWRWMLSSSGVVNFAAQAIGLTSSPVSFFSSTAAALITTILINSWRWFPLLTVILLAGIRNVPSELTEAALVDGATEGQTWRHIVMPLLRPILYVVGLLGTLLSVNVFDIIWLLTRGGPSGGTTTLPVHIYETAFTQFRLGNAAAASVMTTALLLVFVMLFLSYGWGRDLGNEP